MKRILCIFGTRPEAIKMAPVIYAFKAALEAGAEVEPITCLTGQHRDLIGGILDRFGITAEYDLKIMKPGQTLAEITTHIMNGIGPVFEEVRPEMVLVHGDTSTSYAAAVAAFYRKIPIGHVEAGLRTHDVFSPFPEEFNRRSTGILATLHFAPTEQAVRNLLKEGVDPGRILQSGNTGIDALLHLAESAEIFPEFATLVGEHRFALLTAHRRENFGAPLESIFKAISMFFSSRRELQCIYPVHPNPNVTEPAHRILGNLPNVHLIKPVDYAKMVYLLKRCHLVLTDSGGLQEEAPSLGKPVLVLRETTERPEVIETGQAMLVGHDSALIQSTLTSLFEERSETYSQMSQSFNPFGDGRASQRIVEAVNQFLKVSQKPEVQIAAGTQVNAVA